MTINNLFNLQSNVYDYIRVIDNPFQSNELTSSVIAGTVSFLASSNIFSTKKIFL